MIEATNGDIALRLKEMHPEKRSISPRTVAHHITSILTKLEAIDKAKLIWRAMKSNYHTVSVEQLADLIKLACTEP